MKEPDLVKKAAQKHCKLNEMKLVERQNNTKVTAKNRHNKQHRQQTADKHFVVGDNEANRKTMIKPRCTLRC